MFGLVTLILIGAILVAILFLVGSIMRRITRAQQDEPNVASGDGHDDVGAGAGDVPAMPPQPSRSADTRVVNFVSIPGPGISGLRKDNAYTQPVVPSGSSGSSRPVTPSHIQRPPTPGGNHYRSPRSNTPGVDNVQYRATGTTDADALKETLEHERMFKNYKELTQGEKDEIADFENLTITVYIQRSYLDPLLDLIKKNGDGGPVENVIAYFNKKNDKELSPSDKFVRRSFKIKNKRSNMCRFARLSIDSKSDKGFYKLGLRDYTPYMEEHAPKFDAYKQEISTERSHWEEVEAGLNYNTQKLDVAKISILVPT